MDDTALPIRVAALYRFTPIADCEALRRDLMSVCGRHGVLGTLLVAPEGLNGTIAGTLQGVEAVVAHIRSLPGCERLSVKFSGADSPPFYRMKVRLKREIVTMGQPAINPLKDVGQYVAPADWNALISDPDTILIDTRNAYEVRIGAFEGAIDPQTESFREFPDWFRAHRDELLAGRKSPKVAMYCTGGIRCEKSTAFLKSEGVEAVYHLDGGILKYLESTPLADSLWKGECFVFDQRVSVGHGLALGTHALCHACRMPVSPEDMASEVYEEGVSCPACFGQRDPDRRAGYKERQHQMQLAAARGQAHLGAGPKGS